MHNFWQTVGMSIQPCFTLAQTDQIPAKSQRQTETHQGREWQREWQQRQRWETSPTHIEQAVDEWVVAGVAHRQPVGTEPHDIDVLVAVKNDLWRCIVTNTHLGSFLIQREPTEILIANSECMKWLRNESTIDTRCWGLTAELYADKVQFVRVLVSPENERKLTRLLRSSRTASCRSVGASSRKRTARRQWPASWSPASSRRFVIFSGALVTWMSLPAGASFSRASLLWETKTCAAYSSPKEWTSFAREQGVCT